MIVRMWLKRTAQNEPVICLENAPHDDPKKITHVDTFLVSEELYDLWVPDTNHYPGESLSEGVVYDKPLVPNLKG